MISARQHQLQRAPAALLIFRLHENLVPMPRKFILADIGTERGNLIANPGVAEVGFSNVRIELADRSIGKARKRQTPCSFPQSCFGEHSVDCGPQPGLQPFRFRKQCDSADRSIVKSIPYKNPPGFFGA